MLYSKQRKRAGETLHAEINLVFAVQIFIVARTGVPIRALMAINPKDVG